MLRDDLTSLAPYAHAMDEGALRDRYNLTRVVKLGSNESPLGPSPLAVKAMQQAAMDAGRYPQADNSRLLQAIASHAGIPADHLCAGNGGDECIDLLIRVLAKTGKDSILTCRPCFDVYRTQAVVCGVRHLQVPLRADFSLPLQELAATADEHTALVIVTSPDNPSGLVTPREKILELARALPKRTLLLVDEAYVDFCDAPDETTCLPLVEGAENLAVLRTFSKAWGLAGARLGYVAAPLAVADMLRRAQIPFSVNRFAQQGGMAALQDREHYAATVACIREGRAFMAARLAELGCKVLNSQSNFLMFSPPADAAEVFQGLLEQGILIRALKPTGLPDWLRVTVGVREECELFLHALERLLNK